MRIPQKDLVYGMPFRWAFHIWATKYYGLPEDYRWEFHEWREHLLSWDQGGLELLASYLKNNIDDLENKYRPMLKYFEAETIVGMVRLWFKCCEEYEKLLSGEVVSK